MPEIMQPVTPTGQYFDPTIPQVYPSYEAIRYLHPTMSIPRNRDLPTLNLFLIYRGTPPVTDSAHYPVIKEFPILDEVTGKYIEDWEVREF